MSDSLQVWLDTDFLTGKLQIGTLTHDRSAIHEGRAPRTLYAWDYLIGVQDFTRQGALRLRREGESNFLADHPRSAPPVASLRELEAAATEITAKRLDDLDALGRWLAVLVAPGASLGGARPKANFTDTDQSLWIAKFPAKDDERNIGAWESLAHGLASRCEAIGRDRSRATISARRLQCRHWKSGRSPAKPRVHSDLERVAACAGV